MILKKGNVERIAVDDDQAAKLKALDFEPTDAAEIDTTPEKTVSMEAMKVPELKKLAKEKGIEGADSLNRAELLMVLKDVV